MNLLRFLSAGASVVWILFKLAGLNTTIYFMYSRCYLHGYRNRILSNKSLYRNASTPSVRAYLSFLSEIRSLFEDKRQNNVLDYISSTQKSRTESLVDQIKPNLIAPLTNETIVDAAQMETSDSAQEQPDNIYYAPERVSRNYAFARIPEEGSKLYLTVYWNNNKLKLEREKSETVAVTLARLKRNLGKVEGGREARGRARAQEEVPDYSISFLTNLFKTFDENSICEDAILKSSFISINDNLLKLFTNVPKLDKVKLLHTSMVDCPVSLVVKDEEENLYSHVLVEWLDSHGNLLSNNLMYIPTLSDLGKSIKVRVTNSMMRYDVFESNLSRVDLSPYCPWQLERIHRFNTAPKSLFNPQLQDANCDVRAVSFNILSPTYLSSTDSTSNFFPYCPTEYIDCNYRNQLIGREINYLSPQILCLQECASRVYTDYLSYLFAHKYHSWFTIKGGKAGEGCAMFVNKNNFEPLDMLGIYFKEAVRNEEYKYAIDALCRNWLYFNDNYFDKYHTVYQFGLYRIKFNGKFVFVANTHLYFHPMASHIRLLQTYVLLNELEKFKGSAARKYGFDVARDSYTLICGDFNSFPDESIHKFVTKGYISFKHPDWKLGETFVYDKNVLVQQGYEPFKGEVEVGHEPFDKSNFLIVDDYQGYTDSYAHSPLPFTNYCEIFNGTLDFIFHSNNVQVRGCPHTPQVKRTMPGISFEDASEHVGLPSKLYPSDHLSIGVDF